MTSLDEVSRVLVTVEVVVTTVVVMGPTLMPRASAPSSEALAMAELTAEVVVTTTVVTGPPPIWTAATPSREARIEKELGTPSKALAVADSDGSDVLDTASEK